MTSKKRKYGSIVETTLPDSRKIVGEVYDRLVGTPTEPANVSTLNPLTSTPSTRQRQHPQPVDVTVEPVDVNALNVDVNAHKKTSTPSRRQRQHPQPVDVNAHKHRVPLNFERSTIWLPKNLSSRFTTFCKKNGYKKSELITEALRSYLDLKEGVDVNTFQPVDVNTFQGVDVNFVSHDDKTIHDDNIIIMAFERVTNRKATQRDKRLATKYKNSDPRLLEIAFINTAYKKLQGNTSREPIGSFAYFIPQIEILLLEYKDGLLPQDLATYHKYCLHKWETEIRPLRDKKWPKK